MTLLQIVVLALIQGLTEFLPVSSSAHLILGGKLFGWPDQGLVFDVATHLGTLLAVLIYFRRELLEMAGAWRVRVATPADQQQRNLALYLAAASVPALMVGYFAHDVVEFYLRDLRVIAWMTIGFGLLLWMADRVGAKHGELHNFGLGSAMLVGLAQALALIPGVSRSGITITAGRLLGFSPEAAARFSFLLAIPVVAGAGIYGALRVANGNGGLHWPEFLLAFAFAALAGWICIAAFLALLRRVGLLPFILYRLALGLVLLWVLSAPH